MNLADKAPLMRRTAWALMAVAAVLLARALWLGMHLKEAPETRNVMMQWLVAGVGTYMVGRFLLIRLRWVEKKRKKAV